MVANLRVCTNCGHHFAVTARERIVQIADEGSFTEIARGLRSDDPLGFVDSEALPGAAARRRALDRASRRGHRRLVLHRRHVDRDRRARLLVPRREHGLGGGARSSPAPPTSPSRRRLPLVSISASGGARMQEGVLALMQMAKTVAAVDELHEARPPVRLRARASDHRRRGGELRRARRRRDRRARRAALVLGPARREADDPRDAARRLRPRRVELPPRPRRPDRARARSFATRSRGSLALLTGGRPTGRRCSSATSTRSARSAARSPACAGGSPASPVPERGADVDD